MSTNLFSNRDVNDALAASRMATALRKLPDDCLVEGYSECAARVDVYFAARIPLDHIYRHDERACLNELRRRHGSKAEAA